MPPTAKVKMPDGRGGWMEIEGSALPGGTADVAKQQQALDDQFMLEVGNLTIATVKFLQALCKERSLTPEHFASAVNLISINARQTYPEGIRAYDDCTRRMWAHYEKEEPVLSKKEP